MDKWPTPLASIPCVAIIFQTLRKDLLLMKTYFFVHCSQAMECQLLKKLDPFPHFKEGAKRFSLLDLKALHEGDLLKILKTIHREFSLHIKECSVSITPSPFHYM